MSKFKPWIEHRAPIGMISAPIFAISKHSVALFVHRTSFFIVLVSIHDGTILINVIISRIVERIDINYLDFIEITLLEEFEGFEIISLDIDILCILPVFALFHAGP